MNIQRAKLILQSARPDETDAGAPELAEARQLLRADPALRAWYERVQRFDRGMTHEVAGAPVPADLRARILADHRPDAAPARAWWRNGFLLVGGLAAAAVVAAVCWRAAPRAVPAAQSPLAEFAVVDAQTPNRHGGHGEDAANLNHALNQPTARLGAALPVDFHTLRDTGCRTVHVQGRDVLEMCFRRNGVQFHCYIAQKTDFPQLTAPPAPAVVEKGKAAIATWADAANVYVVVSNPGRAPLEKIL